MRKNNEIFVILCFQVESINFNSKPCIVRESDNLDAEQQNQLHGSLTSEEDKLTVVESVGVVNSNDQPRFYLNEQRSNHASSELLSTSVAEVSGEFDSLSSGGQQQQQQQQQLFCALQQSPDSKRFKCESSLTSKQQQQQQAQDDGGEIGQQQQQQEALVDDDVSTLSRLSEFNRSKKVF